MMDSEFRIDLNDVLRNVATGEVISILLTMLNKVLLIDTRSDALEGPMVRIEPRVQNIEERFRRLRRLRPRFPQPEAIIVVPWPRPVAGLERMGIIDALSKRFAQEGFVTAIQDLRRCYEELKAMEQDLIRKAITGEDFHTIWEAKR
jgi:hypothetical protein